MATVRDAGDADMIAELEAILNAQPDPEGYYTAEEWAELLGCSLKIAQARLKVAKKLGRLSLVGVKREALNGKMMPSTGYRIVPAA